MLHADPPSPPKQDSHFRLAMASSGIGMAIVDLQGVWVEVNPALERMFGYGAGELIGRSVYEISHPDDVEDSRRYVAQLASGDVPVLDAHKRYLHRNGNIVWTHINVAAMRGADGEPLYFISQIRDISRQQAAEQALRDLNTSLEERVAERANALEAAYRQQDLFARGVSHDLRAPLRSIDSFAQLLATDYGDRLDDSGRGYLGRISAAVKRMGSLIDSLQELSRVGRNEYTSQVVDISLLAEWSGADLQDKDPDRSASIQVQPGLQAIGDERYLKQLFDQLLHNAWKFSAACERVQIEVIGERRGDVLLLSIRDHGAGFDTRYAAKMFDPFQRLHSPDQGAGDGLGLAIARGIVERHGGTIRAESEAGAGAVFHVELPAPQQDNDTPA